MPQDIQQQIIDLIGKAIVYGGGGSVVAFGIFRFLGTKWIEGKFSEKLEVYKHAHAKELEDVRFKINSTFNRLSKLHEKEFEILPHAWEKLNNCYQSIARCVMIFRSLPDLNRLTGKELEEFLGSTNFSESSKDRIRSSSDKVRTYSELQSWHEINEAHIAFNEFHSYIVVNRIFMEGDLKVKFDAIDNILWKVWVNQRVANDTGNSKMKFEDFQNQKQEIDKLMKDIESIVHGLLHQKYS